ncbi:unnamed protein product [Nyctereutes procyonoides]|uniref:(raccoon dog) hypothetical protein n=1 Tax=Nyctereutes procyonoides TaxID=34880 RepID=A0A811ZL64_NYCPR|nr:unnamed protein product [Nyctereutes procyonoides]
MSVGETAPKEKPNKPAVRQPRQGPTNEAQMAATPKARGPTSQESIWNQVRKELRAEATVSGSTEAPGTNMVPEPREEGSAHLAVPGVWFTCPLTGATLRKDQRDAHIKEAILSHFSTDPVAASIMKIHTFNRDRDKVKLGVDTIAKYLDNICLHPEEEKYRKIKLQNKVFQEHVNCLEGTHEFFEAIGFQKALLPVPNQEGPEKFYVLSEAAVAEPQSLQRHKDQLLVAKPMRIFYDIITGFVLRTKVQGCLLINQYVLNNHHMPHTLLNSGETRINQNICIYRRKRKTSALMELTFPPVCASWSGSRLQSLRLALGRGRGLCLFHGEYSGKDTWFDRKPTLRKREASFTEVFL